jgi:hypothetical protein
VLVTLQRRCIGCGVDQRGGDNGGTAGLVDCDGDFAASGLVRVVGMTGSVGCDGRTSNVHLDIVPAEEIANMDEVLLVHPRLGDDGPYDLMGSVVCDFDVRASES